MGSDRIFEEFLQDYAFLRNAVEEYLDGKVGRQLFEYLKAIIDFSANILGYYLENRAFTPKYTTYPLWNCPNAKRGGREDGER